MRMKTISDFIENELTRHRDIVDKLTLSREETELEGYVKPKKEKPINIKRTKQDNAK